MTNVYLSMSLRNYLSCKASPWEVTFWQTLLNILKPYYLKYNLASAFLTSSSMFTCLDSAQARRQRNTGTVLWNPRQNEQIQAFNSETNSAGTRHSKRQFCVGPEHQQQLTVRWHRLPCVVAGGGQLSGSVPGADCLNVTATQRTYITRSEPSAFKRRRASMRLWDACLYSVTEGWLVRKLHTCASLEPIHYTTITMLNQAWCF